MKPGIAARTQVPPARVNLQGTTYLFRDVDPSRYGFMLNAVNPPKATSPKVALGLLVQWAYSLMQCPAVQRSFSERGMPPRKNGTLQGGAPATVPVASPAPELPVQYRRLLQPGSSFQRGNITVKIDADAVAEILDKGSDNGAKARLELWLDIASVVLRDEYTRQNHPDRYWPNAPSRPPHCWAGDSLDHRLLDVTPWEVALLEETPSTAEPQQQLPASDIIVLKEVPLTARDLHGLVILLHDALKNGLFSEIDASGGKFLDTALDVVRGQLAASEEAPSSLTFVSVDDAKRLANYAAALQAAPAIFRRAFEQLRAQAVIMQDEALRSVEEALRSVEEREEEHRSTVETDRLALDEERSRLDLERRTLENAQAEARQDTAKAEAALAAAEELHREAQTQSHAIAAKVEELSHREEEAQRIHAEGQHLLQQAQDERAAVERERKELDALRVVTAPTLENAFLAALTARDRANAAVPPSSRVSSSATTH